MNHTAASPVIELQLAHTSVRSYSDEPIRPELLQALIQAGQAAASSNFTQAYSVVRVTRPEARTAIARAAGDQAWVEQAAEFLVFCADLHRVDLACRRAGMGEAEGWTEHGIVAVVDTGLMAQNVLLAAESVGLGGVFVGGIRNDLSTVAEQLQLPDRVAPLFGLCLGWPAQRDPVKPRVPTELILHQDVYRETTEDELAAYDAVINDYYQSRPRNPHPADWSHATADAVQNKRREYLLGFLQARGFFTR
jgi:nitroreductase